MKHVVSEAELGVEVERGAECVRKAVPETLAQDRRSRSTHIARAARVTSSSRNGTERSALAAIRRSSGSRAPERRDPGSAAVAQDAGEARSAANPHARTRR